MAHDFLIPKHKRLTGKARAREESVRATKEFLKMVSKDKLLLLSIVTGGKAHWKGIASKAFRGHLVDDTMVGQMFEFMVQMAGPEPKRQFEELQRSELVALKLERLQGLARFITSEQHLDEVLDRCVPAGDERQAIRTQLLFYWRAQEQMH